LHADRQDLVQDDAAHLIGVTADDDHVVGGERRLSRCAPVRVARLDRDHGESGIVGEVERVRRHSHERRTLTHPQLV